MPNPHYSHTATLLPQGKVLIAGGWLDNSGDITPDAELYDRDKHVDFDDTHERRANRPYGHVARQWKSAARCGCGQWPAGALHQRRVV